ncbi:DUF2971 domain-containing protein [Pelagicoccus sp. NFK12]|uniref:DUF2971 domain-containing protein n=1 Tax=Pelagicoccus enzymogenes TaxID=2773457 RepID=A0A927IE92_9BACT|nr:DUF2971 domain-containing protein [Pelagicoccus enzymogenes]MBD5778782.1 DUF2971 domain-containing protein [Pelagicoccus enzymogenes]
MNPPLPPEKLIHYTNAKVAASILLNKELWLSNARDMNDISEIEHGWRILETNSGIARAIDKFGLRENLESWENDFMQNTFFSCFSQFKGDHEERDGRLSMWRGYGGEHPVGIIFNTQVLQGLLGHSVHSFRLDKVSYDQNEQRDKVLAAVDVHAPTTEKDPIKIMDALQPIFYQLPFFTKHPGFEEEQEWRLLYNTYHDTDKVAPFEPTITNEWMLDDEANPIRRVAKLKLTKIRDPEAANPINDGDSRDLIPEIIIGPMPEYNQCKIAKTLQNIADDSVFNNIIINRSQIPYRNRSNRAR